MKLSEYASYDATGLADLVARKEVSADELTDAARRGIAAVNPQLNFMVDAIEPAIAGNSSGAFAGVPFLIKDIMMTAAGVPQGMGTRLLDNDVYVAPHDGELMRRFKAAGLNTLGRTTTPEYGFNATTESVATGPSRNPWDPSRTTGGSSGGAAAAVAAGVVPIAHANDGGGSIRIPAACCGLVGLKPSRGRTPLGPDAQLAILGLGIEFAVTRTTRDAAALLDLVAGPEVGSFIPLANPQTPYADSIKRPMQGLRIAIAPTGFQGAAPTDAGMSAEVVRIGKLLADLGHEVEEITHIPLDHEQFHTANYRFWMATLAAASKTLTTAFGIPSSADVYETCTLKGIEDGQAMTAVDMMEAVQIMGMTGHQMGAFFAGYDAVILPPFAAPPIELGVLDQNHPDWSARQFYDELFSRFNATAPFNVTGQPAITVPTGLVEGLPAGVQIATSLAREDILLNLSAQLEGTTDWSARRPAVSVANV